MANRVLGYGNYFNDGHATGKYHGLLLPDSAQLLDLEMAILVRCTSPVELHAMQWILSFEHRSHRPCMCLQESLDFNLIVYSPYRDLAIFLQDAQTTDLAECAW